MPEITAPLPKRESFESPPLVRDLRVLPRIEDGTDAQARVNLFGLVRSDFRKALLDAGTAPEQIKMREAQLWQWIYQKGVRDFAQMSNLAKSYRALLARAFCLQIPEVVMRQISKDGTRKYLLRVDGGHEIETVYIPGEDRGTICISSQIGCTLNCSFCHTGTQRLVRNLTAAEILGQIIVVRDDLGEWPLPVRAPKNEQRLISNIVLMGMGEPLYNFAAVRDAMKIAMDSEGIAISRRRITLSTSGIVPEIARTATEIGCLLAISLHATTDTLRNQLVPINKRWNIESLFEALRAYPNLSNSERITFEYVMLRDVNDSDADARRLLRLIRGIPAKINLIPFNKWPGAPYECATSERIRAFATIIHKAGYASPIRTPRGEDIMAACGQLKSMSARLSQKARALSPASRAP